MPAQSFLISLLDAAARSLLLACAVGLGLAVLRVRNVVAQKAAWILVLASSLAMPLVARWAAHASWLPDRDTFVLSHAWTGNAAGIDATPAAIRPAAFAGRASRQDEHVVAEAAPIASSTSRFPAPAIETQASVDASPAPPVAPAAVRRVTPWITPAQGLMLIYLAVCGFFLLRVAYGAWAAFRLWRKAQPASPDWVALARGAQVRISGAISSPVTIGSGIVLPPDCGRWDAEKLRVVLAHESSHVRQRDFALQLAASLYIALTWFSPLGWWLKGKLAGLSETISDGAAVDEAASHASYAKVLLEFAALPRPIPLGVAMAHRGHLRSRIEHLLNESRFRQAFSGGRARVAIAVLLVPVALFAATAMVRVQAAGQQAPPAQAPDTTAAPAKPAPAQSAAPAPQAAPTTKPPSADPAIAPPAPAQPTPPLPGNDELAPVAPGGFGVGPSGGPSAPLPPGLLSAQIASSWANIADARALLKGDMARVMALRGNGFFRDGFFNDGNSYAYVTGPGKEGVHYSGGWFDNSREEIERARTVAHGDFIWFERDGKSYVIDDQATLAELKPMQDQMDALGKQQEELGKQQEELGKQQEELGRQMEQLRVPTPDMQKEMAKLKAVQDKLAALQGKDASQEQLSEIEGQLAEVQGQLGALQGDMGGRQGELGGKMGELGGQQGRLGAQQGRLGAQQGRIAREMDGKVLTIIDECMKNGKARPVQ